MRPDTGNPHAIDSYPEGRLTREVSSAQSHWPKACCRPSALVHDARVGRLEQVAAQGGSNTVYQDRSLTCRDCGESFVFSSGEQEFFASKGLVNDPQRCPSCRAAAKRARSTGAPGGGREYHAAVCNSCGGQAIVPFQPRNDRPVYCSSCFDKVKAEAAGSA
jgi:CxxC-x17-CxxC domain-containing protein